MDMMAAGGKLVDDGTPVVDSGLGMGHGVAWGGQQLVAVPIQLEVGREVAMELEGFPSWV